MHNKGAIVIDTIDKIIKLLREKGISGAKMSRDLGFSNAVFSQWKNHKQNPSNENLKKIADYFDVSVEFLTEKNSIKEAPSQNEDAISEAEKKIHQNIKLLNDEGLEKAIEYIDFLIAQEKQKRSKSDRDS